MSTRGEIRERWRRILRDQPSSGLSVAAFCRRAGVPYSGFYKWRDKLGELGRQAVFSEVKLAAAGSERHVVNAGDLEVRLAGQRSIVVRPGFDRRTLIELLAILETGGHEVAGAEAQG
jgi:transposase-like protein